MIIPFQERNLSVMVGLPMAVNARPHKALESEARFLGRAFPFHSKYSEALPMVQFQSLQGELDLEIELLEAVYSSSPSIVIVYRNH